MRFAICNETFRDWPLERAAECAADLGYDGLELAPFTLCDDVRRLSTSARRDLRRAIERHGLRVAGLHWLLIQPPGMHITSPDPRPRREAAEYLRELIRLCRHLGADTIVFGSPAQRTLPPNTAPAEGWERAVQVFRDTIPIADSRKVAIAFEPLTTQETDFVTSAAEARRLVEAVKHPRFRLALDVCAMERGESASPADVIRAHAMYLRHVHVNDATGLGPGMGSTDLRPVAEALRETGYNRWLSVEVFASDEDPERIARESLRYLRESFEGG